MPVHDLGYRAWSGTRLPPLGRWSTIVSTGVRLAWKGQYLRRLLFVAWVPVLYVAGLLIASEWVMLQQGALAVAAVLPSVIQDSATIARLTALAASDPGAFRAEFWARLIHFYFKTPQPLLMALIVGLVAPPLISRDLRSRAWLIYFSRPISRLDYLAGKCAVVAVFLLAITALPALFLYVLGIGLSPTAESVATTWMLPVRIAGASLVVILPTMVLSVCLSSLWHNSRTSTFAWYAIWIVGAVVYRIMTTATGGVFAPGPGGPAAASEAVLAEGGPDYPVFVLLSFYDMLAAVQGWIFGIHPLTSTVVLALSGLLAVTVGSGLLLFRRISAPMRI